MRDSSMSYHQFTVEDFVLNKHFRQWVLSPDAESNMFWQSWLARHPEKREVLQEARAIILAMPRINYGWNPELEENLWQSIVQDTQASPQGEEKASTKVVPLHADAVLGTTMIRVQHKRWHYQTMGRVASTILLLLCFGLAGYLGYHVQHAETSVMYITHDTPPGSRSAFNLPDGSHIVLHAGSSARYPKHFAAQERLVEIKGEAFLTVARDSLRPFRVRTGKVMTEALGTAFNVRYEQHAVEIALVEGKVQVSLAGSSTQEEKLILMPGERAILQEDKYLVRDVFNSEKVTAWKEGMIFFDSAGEAEVIQTLERWYGVKISIEGQPSKSWNFTGKFKDKDLEYVLKSVGYTMNFSFTKEKDQVKIMYP